MTFGDFIKRELNKRGWTVKRLAEKSKVDHAALSKMVSGSKSTCSVKTMQLIVKDGLEMNFNDLEEVVF